MFVVKYSHQGCSMILKARFLRARLKCVIEQNCALSKIYFQLPGFPTRDGKKIDFSENRLIHSGGEKNRFKIKRSVKMWTTNFYQIFFKNSMMFMNGQLSKIRSVHTYFMHRMFCFEWYWGLSCVLCFLNMVPYFTA